TPTCWIVWTLSILFFTSSIFYVKMLVSRVSKKPASTAATLYCAGYHVLLLGTIALLIYLDWISAALMLAFAPIILRAFWSLMNRSGKLQLKQIGITEILWTLVFVAITTKSLRH